jgi:hypothetical protein
MQWPPAASAAELLAYDDEHLDPGLGELSHCGCLVALVGDDDAWLERDDVVAVVPLFPLRLELVAAGRDELQVGDPECALDLLEESALGDLRLYAGVAAGAGQERPNLRGDRLVERGDVAVAEAEDRVERTRLARVAQRSFASSIAVALSSVSPRSDTRWRTPWSSAWSRM